MMSQNKGMTCRKLPLLWLFVGVITLPMVVTNAQAPFYTTPQFSNVNHRTNVCDRFAAYANGQLEIRDALSGLQLSVGVVDQPNPLYFNLHRNNITINDQFPGIFVEILDELARRGNFTWRETYARILPPNMTQKFDATWTDVLVDSVERYDISFAEWVHTHERRRRGVHFPVGWYDTSTIFIRNTREGIKNEFNFNSWTRPLHWSLWALFALGFLYNRTMLWILDKIEDDGSPREITSKEKVFRIRMVEIVFDSDRSNAKRLHNMSSSLFAMVFVSSLTANLATFLIQQSEPDFQYVGLDDLDSRFTPVCVRQADAVFESLSNDYETMNFIRSDTSLENYQRILAGDCKVVATRRADFDIFERNPVANPDCTLEWVGRPEYINFGGMGTIVDTNTTCTSLVGHVLDLHMHEMTEFVEEAWENYLADLSSYECPAKVAAKEDTRYSLTLNDIGGIFIVFAGVAFLGLFVAMIEQHFERKRRAQEEEHDLLLKENGPTEANMLGEADPIHIDSEVLKRILAIDQAIAKLKYECGGEKRPSRSGSGGGLGLGASFRGLGSSFRGLTSPGGASFRGLNSSPRNSGGGTTPSPGGGVRPSLLNTASPRSQRSLASPGYQRPTMSQMGKKKSQQNILAMG
ncbi:unnamed protein product [Cylindrotheca closterium]|uniref:Ionotropic glutamate receptor C-terminal domain-containing protein n=1 Tax=Cylindrotheca closterium TaxID=2856 RepID=A0AAD2JJW9_9STRA|nr:unnamed protein product [Cylindrotheca closterium]